MKRIAILALCACAHAPAAVTPFFEATAPEGLAPGLQAYDIVVNITPGDNLLRYTLQANIVSGMFVDPDPAQRIFALGGTLADTWLTAVNAPPNPLPPTGEYGSPTETVQIVITPESIQGGLFAFGPTQAPGDSIIARILVAEGSVFDVNVGVSSQLNPPVVNFGFRVPGAGPASVVAGAALLAFTRRRRD